MGIGYNITKATRCVNVEPDWCQDTNDQGNDRMNRIGQRLPYHTQYIAFDDSIDFKVLSVGLRKRKLSSYL